MKSTTLIFILLIIAITASAQTKREKRYLERLAKKQEHSDYRMNPLPGVRYKKAIRPKTVGTLAVIVFLGVAAGNVIYEEFKSPNQKP